MHPTIRASDADRERVVAELQRHVGTGRLTLDEFSERAGTAYRATTVGELADLCRDLPTAQEGRRAGSRRHHIPAAAVVAATVLSLVLGGAALATGAAVADASPSTVIGEMCH